MCEVLKNNFNEKYPEIVKNIKDSAFISFDFEFSSLPQNEDDSLFTTSQEKYERIRAEVENVLIFQVGISTFKYLREENQYVSKTYVLYTLPSPLSSYNQTMIVETDVINFLSRYNFDFNKLFHQGIHFVTTEEQKIVLDKLKTRPTHLKTCFHLSNEEYELSRRYINEISDWLTNSSRGSSLVLDVQDCPQNLIDYLSIKPITKFGNIWVAPFENSKLKVSRISSSERNNLREAAGDSNGKLYEEYLGFSKLITEIIISKKPIIGHNIYLDLMLLMKQFIGPLPPSYLEYKKKVVKLFPEIYDTKYICLELRSKKPVYKSTMLKSLFECLSNQPFSSSTTIVMDPDLSEKLNNYHDAGFDSYCAGYCFIRLAFFSSSWNPETASPNSMLLPFSPSLLSAAVKDFKNQVNVTKSYVQTMNLVGDDEVPRPYLHIESRNFKTINFEEISNLLSKYDAVEIKPFNNYRALLAVRNEIGVNQILKALKRHEDLKISEYHFLWHSPLLRGLLWGGGAAGIVLGTYVFWKHKKNLISVN